MTTYAAKSSARRAARAQGVDPDRVVQAEDGRWQLPPAAAPEDSLAIPEYLKVENRKPLTKAQEERLAEARGGTQAQAARRDPRKPKGMSWEEWDAHVEETARSKRAALDARFAGARESRAAKQKARVPRPRREDAFSPDAVIEVLLDANPCRAGTAAHAVFAKYKTGMTVAKFTKAVEGLCPGRLRAIDYLIYDARKGRIAVGAKK